MKKRGTVEAVVYMGLLLGALLACANGGGAGSDAGQTQQEKCGGIHLHRSECKNRMKATLKSPDSAEWAGVLEDFVEFAPDCTETFRSHVTAKNGLGMPVKMTYVCTYNPKTKAISFQSSP